MWQYSDGNDPAAFGSSDNKRDWTAFEENTDQRVEESKRVCVEGPEIIEANPVSAMSLSAWDSLAGFGGSMNPTGTTNFQEGGMLYGLDSHCEDSAQKSAKSPSLPNLLWFESDTASRVLETGMDIDAENVQMKTSQWN
jgi:hypothetical protein